MAKKLWGGRFTKKTDPLVEQFTKSIQYDYKLAKYDVLGSMLHVSVLKRAGFLTSAESSKLQRGLKAISDQLQNKELTKKNIDEDIHTYIQNELQKKVGDLALKLHTARSRNDQVVFATKLYCKMALLDSCEDILGLTKEILNLADRNSGLIMPGFTHMQHAQPVLLHDYLEA